MPDLTNFSLDPLSFWIGMAAATVLWWLIGKLKSQFPGFKNYFQKIFAYVQKRRAADIAYPIKLAALRRAQTEHLAKCLFSLDDILIPPRLVLPRIPGDPKGIPHAIPVIDQILPYTPDFPELTANFGGTTISLSQALSKGANLVLIGCPGSGKTIALANLATEIARGQTEVAADKLLNRTLPIFLHVLDLDFSRQDETGDPLGILIDALESEVSIFSRKRLGPFLKNTIEKGEAILLLDGFDELPVQQTGLYRIFLKEILTKYPSLQIVVAASPDYLDGLLGLGLYPVAMAAWSTKDRQDFLYKWKNAWEREIKAKINDGAKALTNYGELLTGWLEAENKIFSPLEWTLLVWGAFNGELGGFGIHQALDSYIHWASHPFTPRLALESLAFETYMKGVNSQTYDEVENFFAKFHPKNLPAGNTENNLQTQKSPNKRTKKITSSQRAINSLLERGLLIEHRTGLIRFSNPLVAGYLASHILGNDGYFSSTQSFCTIELTALQFWTSKRNTSHWIDAALQEKDDPIYRKLLQAGRALKYSPPGLKWHGEYLKKILTLMHDDRVFMPVKIRLLAMLVLSNDPSIPALFHQLLNSKKREVRFLSVLGLGALGEIRSTNDIARLISDPDSRIRETVCLALSSSKCPQIMQIKHDILQQGDENQRIIVAESFALQPPEGPEILVSALSSQDILTRRAAVAGLSRIKEEWAIELLEKIAIEDGQWVVKNAALQGAEGLNNLSLFAPPPYTPPAESSWLISFASRHGLGIPAGDPAIDMLLFALNAGSSEEKIAAADYLKGFPNREVIQELLKTLQTASEEILQERAYLALNYLLSSDMTDSNQIA
ncbi:MAG: NACHT domain-containing protein [Anaerolineae bacterium]|nr:NACHT domain-containing protein [Anaerolineae bacterium]